MKTHDNMSRAAAAQRSAAQRFSLMAWIQTLGMVCGTDNLDPAPHTLMHEWGEWQRSPPLCPATSPAGIFWL